jgi:hypothetical protein
MAIGDQDGGRVAVAVPGMLAGGILETGPLPSGLDIPALSDRRSGVGAV